MLQAYKILVSNLKSKTLLRRSRMLEKVMLQMDLRNMRKWM